MAGDPGPEECSFRVQKTLDYYDRVFERELHDAEIEVSRLAQLFRDVCWYNFETTARKWRRPWHETLPRSRVQLQGMRFETKWHRGCKVEFGRFPVYYDGTIDQAPGLPPEIALSELSAAKAHLEACQKQRTAHHDWAPGGAHYEALRRVTAVGRDFSGVSET